MQTIIKTKNALCGLLSGLLLLAAVFASIAPARADLLVTDFIGDKVERFDSVTGASLGTFASLSRPSALAYDSSGNVYVGTFFGNTIQKFSSTGTPLGTFASTGLNAPTFMAFDGGGNLYAANNGNSTIRKFSSTGTDLGVFASVSGPWGLAFDGGGNLFAADSANNISMITPGGSVSVYASLGTHRSIGLAFDLSGNLFATDFNNNGVTKIAPGGVVSTFISTTAALDGPTGLAFDLTGNLYVSNMGNSSTPAGNTIREFSSLGTDLGTFADGGPESRNSMYQLSFGYIDSTLITSPVPEPSTFALAGVSGLMLLLWRRRGAAASIAAARR